MLVATVTQLAAVLAFVALDGVARRLVLCPPDLPSDYLAYVVETAGVDAVVADAATSPAVRSLGLPCIEIEPTTIEPPGRAAEFGTLSTEWILFTSGTTSRPKLVVHDLASLSAPFVDATALEQGAVWSTFYDVRRYGGLTILLRALLSGASMVLSEPGEAVADFLQRTAANGVTHISGTPSHWRRALMSPAAAAFAPHYVRLSGEVADQALLDRLRTAFPGSGVAHAFASTEAGVAFSVADGLAGFPASWADAPGGRVEIRLQDGSMLLRSANTAHRYLGDASPLRDPDGFVDTGDMLELHNGRYVFVGRRTGIINVGGQKVHPEEVEAVINRHPRVQMSRVRARKSPITGAVVVADVVVRAEAAESEGLEEQIVTACREVLARHKVPVSVQIVPALDILTTGKMARRSA